MNNINNSYFEEIESFDIQKSNRIKQNIRKGISHKNLYEVDSLEGNYYSLGTINFCYHNNIAEGKKFFYQASLCHEWTMEHYEEYQNNLEAESVTTYSYPKLYDAILSGNTEHRNKMAELFGRYAHLEQNEFLANKLLGYSLKYVILDDKQNANKWLDDLENAKSKRGMKQYVEGHGRAMRGLINYDEEEFNIGLKNMLKAHVARMKREGNTLEQFFAYDSVALAMIAKERGIKVTVKHELLPDEYFVETDINYNEITMIS